MSDHEAKIRARAHEIWESENRPEGRHGEHWDQANRELGDAQQDASGMTVTRTVETRGVSTGDDPTAVPQTPLGATNDAPRTNGSDSGQIVHRSSETRSQTVTQQGKTSET